ncbi:hypothetical protein RhiirA4_427706 [Rhizophagus irregularis]|uniref:Uncharacterized protein n=1 Tax=Rhizophagus irregularis TaxID=588596 RepID=A0A2I1H9Z3_9GLOM|nr:hypothetical protein RhiirA4_427706 [Rhizophagus irregularis]
MLPRTIVIPACITVSGKESKDQGAESVILLIGYCARDDVKLWQSYYQQLYVLVSLNQIISNIDPEIWRKSGSNTNNSESAHSMGNNLMNDVIKQLKSTKPSLKRKLSSSINRNKSSKKEIGEIKGRASEANKKEAKAEALEIVNA